MVEKTYYMQLKSDHKILDKVKRFQKDFTEHDKKALQNYKGDFLYLARESGTHLIKIGKKLRERRSSEDTQHLKSVYQSSRKHLQHKWFYYGHDGKIKKISASEADKIFKQSIDNDKDVFFHF